MINIYRLEENGQKVAEGSYEEMQKKMNKLADVDWRKMEGTMCEVKRGEDYYDRVTAETLISYRLHIVEKYKHNVECAETMRSIRG